MRKGLRKGQFNFRLGLFKFKAEAGAFVNFRNDCDLTTMCFHDVFHDG